VERCSIRAGPHRHYIFLRQQKMKRVRSLAPEAGVPVGVSRFLILDLTRTDKCIAPVERCSMRARSHRHYICNLIGERCCINRWRYFDSPKQKRPVEQVVFVCY